MPPKSKKKVQNKEDSTLSKEGILEIIESRMSEVFETQYEQLKDKLITLMAAELSKLQSKVNNIEEELQTLKEAQNSNTVAIVEGSEESQSFQTIQRKKIDALSKDMTYITDQLKNIQVDIENTKQVQKEKNVRLVGLPENDSPESEFELKKKVIEFSQQHLEIPNITSDDIDEVVRLGQRNTNKPRDMIIKFKCHNIRNKFYQSRRKLYNTDMKRSSTGTYINEDLTQYRQRLYYDTRNLRKKAAIFAVWTSKGTVMVKLEEHSIPKPIQTHRDLANLLSQNRIEVRDD